MKLLVMTPMQMQAPEFVESLRLLDLHWVQVGAPLLLLASRHQFTHVLYTSCASSFLTWDPRSIWAAYITSGRRCLFSTDRDLDLHDYRRTQLPTHRRVYRHLNAMSFMGEIPFVYERLTRFIRGELWREDYKKGVELDKYCEVFQNMGADGYKDIRWDSREGYFVNKYTNSSPCVLSFNEGTPGVSRLFKRWKRQHRRNTIRKALALGYELNP